MVASHTYIFAGVMNCTSLTNNDVTCFTSLSTKYLNA